ncbi:T9SS type A sorting domain-containing protein [Winogradskyella litoriviva]|uniref:T9SS type A sorting domain-containing protein n=1 Tax=Winogradskyella litoriviva TaxID=1220182 RepID=A0ABX2E3G3_9FLAO|nr:T9SS type A sorting domain-containing protein [Winogradskyella litoriviva]NRD23053.1 T9SS type A sorting domain-containing protein [Winogradskyella litoriviva]
MKLKITIPFLVLVTLSLNVFSQTAPCDGILPFEEENGLLTIEMESGIINDDRWEIGTETETINGQTVQTEYLYWTGPESFNNLSNAPIEYNIKINTPGTYRFAWRMRIGQGTATGEHNDAWLKIDGEDFFGLKQGAKVYPKPLCNQDPNLTCAAGSSTQNFIKAFGNRLDWTFVTNTNDGEAYRVFVTFDEAKDYTITVDARSSYLFIDKMVLRLNGISDGVAFDLSNNESACYDASLSTGFENTLEESIKVFPNPTKDVLNIENLPINSKLSITNMLGVTIKSIDNTLRKATIDLSGLEKGIYFLTSSDGKSVFTKKIIKI